MQPSTEPTPAITPVTQHVVPEEGTNTITAGSGPEIGRGDGQAEVNPMDAASRMVSRIVRSVARCDWLPALGRAFHDDDGIALHSYPVTVVSTVPLIGTPDGRSELVTLRMPVDGTMMDVVTRVSKPEGSGRFPVAIMLHGRPAPRLRQDTSILVSEQEIAYWLGRGTAVVTPYRPGYGPTAGADRESHTRHIGPLPVVDVQHQTRQVMPIAVGVHRWLQSEPWSDGRFVVVGRSTGGLAALAAGRLGLDGVCGVVNFSGVSLSNVLNREACSDPREVEKACAAFGHGATVPSLWLYAPNDSTCHPADPARWHAAFRRAGGSDARLFVSPPLDGEGHLLARRQRLWEREVDAFRGDIGFD